MKPAAFDYHAPRTVEEAVALLTAHGEEARILAGGQSLVPTMAFRMARPGVLVDINRIPDLDFLRAEDGVLRIGALARHAMFERPVAPGPVGALLARVVRHIAHAPIRQRGTFCGSLAHADPASEWCTATLALGGAVIVAGPQGQRAVAAEDWFQGVFTTAIAPDEILAEVRLPLLGAEWRCGFAEFARRAGDFALAMAVVALRLDTGRVTEARIALGGIGGRPELAPDAAAALIGQVPRDAAQSSAERAAAGCDPQDDIHAPADYRRDLVRVMVRRAIEDAIAA